MPNKPAPHTPAPWRMIPRDADDNETTLDNATRFEVEGYDCFTVAITDEIGDARLIAAAPELLEALREMLEHVEWVRRHFDFEKKYGKTGPNDCTHRARAAISKAEGAA